MTYYEKIRCQNQLASMQTKELKELAQMLESANSVENEALSLALSELCKRGVHIEKLKIIASAESILHRP